MSSLRGGDDKAGTHERPVEGEENYGLFSKDRQTELSDVEKEILSSKATLSQ